jgi:hypothetical protein
MDGGEHWFHTAEQMAFLDKWGGGDIINNRRQDIFQSAYRGNLRL